MYIESFRIDGFGIFSGVQVNNLPPGLSIFLGRNEAGKSTCLEFLRAMLTGYPDPRSREARRSYAPLRGGQPGGGLVLRADGREALHLTRRPGAGGGLLTLSEADGTALPPELLRQLLFGVSREVYRNVFGFSLSELENFESLSAEGVRNALYGASFGPGLRAPGDALKILERQAEDIFKGNGSKPALNAAIRQLEELRARIEDVAAECAGFDGMALELSHKKAALADLRRRKSDLEGERRLLERRLGVWRQWDEWRMTELRLERLTPVSENFPADGPARLARLQEARETCERQLAAHKEKITRLRERHDAVLVDQPLLEALPELRRLSERKSGYRQALSLQAGQQDSCRRAEADLSRELTRLGPGWDCERIRVTDRSLFAREDLEKQAREMAAAGSAHQAAVDALTKANRDVETAERDVAAAQSALALLPAPVAALGDEARDELRPWPGWRKAAASCRAASAACTMRTRLLPEPMIRCGLPAPAGRPALAAMPGRATSLTACWPARKRPWPWPARCRSACAKRAKPLRPSSRRKSRWRLSKSAWMICAPPSAMPAAPAVKRWTPARRPCAPCGRCRPAWARNANAFRNWTTESTTNRRPRRSKACR